MNFDKSVNSFRHLFDQSTLQILYLKHRKYFLPIGVIFCSLMLFLFVIIPQIQSFFNYRDQEQIIKEKISVLEKNISFLSQFNDSDLDSKLQTISLALPLEKDFILVMQAISKAASKAGVGLGDFSFEIGQISGDLTSVSSTESNALIQTAATDTTRPAVKLTLTVNGGLSQTKTFVSELKNSLPLSEVSQIEARDNSSTVNVAFFYKPLDRINLDEEKALQPLSQKDVELIDKLSALTNN